MCIVIAILSDFTPSQVALVLQEAGMITPSFVIYERETP
jgi:hypothetical protein